ncbi:hypothetical protein F4861DRAFT_543980 [Xylaria intraflava]|nr:hypothetical protein F4861DRAFT_543980 [Xylaria intraflava]
MLLQDATAHHGPYTPSTALVGGVPTMSTDVPIAAVLLTLFVVSAAAHMTVLQLNRRAGLKFLFSGMMFALCFLRTVALSMRIVWACYPHMANIAMAANILTQTGSVLIFIVNLIIAQRIVRAYHAALGWHPVTTFTFRFLMGCVVACLVMAITVTVQSFFTLDEGIRRSDHIVQLFTGTYTALLAFLPIPIIALAVLLPHKYHVEKFGAGRWRSKVRLVLFTSMLATVGAIFRIFTGFATRPVDDPAWYHSRVCYYCFNYVIDLVITATYLLTRFDRRFIVPNGAKGPGDYGKGRRVRRSSASSSSSGTGKNEKDAERNKGASDKDGSEKPSMSTSDSKGKGKLKSMDIENDDKSAASRSAPRLTLSNDIPTYGPGGEWNGVPWPFRTSWAMSRNFGSGRPSSANLNPAGAGAGDGAEGAEAPTTISSDNNNTLASCPRASSNNDDGSSEDSTKWGAETSSSTYIQEPDAILARTRRSFQPHQLQSGQKHEWGEALTSNEEIHLSPPRLTPDTVIWPFTSETQASGRDPVASTPSRHNSAVVRSHASGSRAPSRSHSSVSRSRSYRTVTDPSMEGGWI